jgi:hypothetical protein
MSAILIIDDVYQELAEQAQSRARDVVIVEPDLGR